MGTYKETHIKTQNITNNTQIINKGGSRKAHSIGGLINIKSLIPIMLIIPLVIYLLLVLFDLNNITLFRTKVVNDIELTYFDTFAYVKNLEQSGEMLKAMLKNLALDAFNFPSIGDIQLPFDAPNWLEPIIKVMLILPNLMIWLINVIIFLPLRAILSIFYLLPIALRTIMAIFAIDTNGNFPLNTTFTIISRVVNLLANIEIPYIGA